MSKSREKDTGKYAPHAGGVPSEQVPQVDKLDLSKDPSKPVASNFHRGPLAEGHQRVNAGEGGPVPPAEDDDIT